MEKLKKVISKIKKRIKRADNNSSSSSILEDSANIQDAPDHDRLEGTIVQTETVAENGGEKMDPLVLSVATNSPLNSTPHICDLAEMVDETSKFSRPGNMPAGESEQRAINGNAATILLQEPLQLQYDTVSILDNASGSKAMDVFSRSSSPKKDSLCGFEEVLVGISGHAIESPQLETLACKSVDQVKQESLFSSEALRAQEIEKSVSRTSGIVKIADEDDDSTRCCADVAPSLMPPEDVDDFQQKSLFQQPKDGSETLISSPAMSTSDCLASHLFGSIQETDMSSSLALEPIDLSCELLVHSPSVEENDYPSTSAPTLTSTSFPSSAIEGQLDTAPLTSAAEGFTSDLDTSFDLIVPDADAVIQAEEVGIVDGLNTTINLIEADDIAPISPSNGNGESDLTRVLTPRTRIFTTTFGPLTGNRDHRECNIEEEMADASLQSRPPSLQLMKASANLTDPASFARSPDLRREIDGEILDAYVRSAEDEVLLGAVQRVPFQVTDMHLNEVNTASSKLPSNVELTTTETSSVEEAKQQQISDTATAVVGDLTEESQQIISESDGLPSPTLFLSILNFFLAVLSDILFVCSVLNVLFTLYAMSAGLNVLIPSSVMPSVLSACLGLSVALVAAVVATFDVAELNEWNPAEMPRISSMLLQLLKVEQYLVGYKLLLAILCTRLDDPDGWHLGVTLLCLTVTPILFPKFAK